MKTARKILMVLGMQAAVFLAVWNMLLTVNAQESNEKEMSGNSHFMTAIAAVEAKTEPEQGAETIFSFSEGDIIFVIGETGNGWYIVSYQGETGYIEKKADRAKLEEEEIDVAALNAELKLQEAESKMVVEETERYREESKRSKIWGTVIVLLIVGILGTGIISTVYAEKKKKEE